jgi:hypothetical protein
VQLEARQQGLYLDQLGAQVGVRKQGVRDRSTDWRLCCATTGLTRSSLDREQSRGGAAASPIAVVVFT